MKSLVMSLSLVLALSSVADAGLFSRFFRRPCYSCQPCQSGPKKSACYRDAQGKMICPLKAKK